MWVCVHMYEKACRRPEEEGRFDAAGATEGLWMLEPNLGPPEKQEEF